MTAIHSPIATAADTIETAESRAALHTSNVRLLTARVESIKAAKVDAVANTGALTAVAIDAGANHPAQTIIVGGGVTMQIGEVAHQQFSNVLGIDKRYYDRMVAEAPKLLATNLNYWFNNTASERLLRMLRPAAYTPEEQRGMQFDNVVMQGAGLSAFRDQPVMRLRGVLGKGYRTIDDADLVAEILPMLVERGATLQEFSIDERRMHAAFYTVARDIQTIRADYAKAAGVTMEEMDRVNGHVRVNGRDIAFVNETIASGVVIRHSEVGFASLGASFVQKVMKCLNRMVEEQSLAIRHVGGKNGNADDDVRFISDATQLMENAALLGRVRDTVSAQFEEKKIVERATKLLVAKTETIALPAAQPVFEFVGNMGLNLGLNQTEIEVLKEETTLAIAEEGGRSRFAFVQGITATARQMTDYDRRLEVERAAFAILNDDASALLKLGRDAEKAIKKGRN